MLLFFTAPVDEFASEGQKFSETLTQLKAAFEAGINPDNLVEQLTGLEGVAKKLQRSIGGVVIESTQFSQSMLNAVKNTKNLGTSFSDVKSGIEGLAKGMGRMVVLSDNLYKIQTKQGEETASTLQFMVEFGKATGMAMDAVGEMVAELSRFGGTQVDNLAYMKDLATSARKSGLDAKTFTAEVGKNMKVVSGFGFKSGREGLEKMVKQASVLRTTIEGIGAKGFADNLLDPERAIEAAANMQMLGGAVGKLADPFQLMYMAQNDVAGLQDELLKSTKAAFTFNKATGGFEASTEDLYRLRQQAQITGQNFDDLLSTGKEMAKMDYLKEKFGLGSMDEDTQNLVTGLSQIGEGGKVILDIPGFKRFEADNAEQMQAIVNSTTVQEKLKDYQEIASKTDRQLAEEQMTIAEDQAADIKAIKEYMLMDMSKAQREAFETSLDKNVGDLRDAYVDGVKVVQEPIKEGVSKTVDATNNLARNMRQEMGTFPPDVVRQEEIKEKIRGQFKGFTGATYNVDAESVDDLFVPSSGQAPKVMAAGKLYKGIVGDDVAMGTNLGDALNKKGSMIGGKIDVNINVNGSVAGDSGNITSLFNDPKVQKQIMDTVLYKLDMYKKQQGVI